MLQSAFSAVILSEDLVFFYAGWEAMLLPIFLGIGLYAKDEQRASAAMHMMYYTIFGSMLMLIAIIYVGNLHYEQFGFFSFKIIDLERIRVGANEGAILFGIFMLAFAIKLPLLGVHSWMARAYTLAPTGITFALSAIASKVAIYAILRFVLPIFSAQFIQFSAYFVLWGVVSMMYFGIAAFWQKDFKTLLAYSSASHLGLILAGIFTLHLYSSVGAIYQVISHAMTSGVMFLLVGKIRRDLGTSTISELGGIAKSARVLAVFFAISAFASIGLPGTNAFVGEILILLGLFSEHFYIAFFAT
ncbi:MAG: NADH-quinone oxidoreductase subunit M, partial [Deltaproteobacteria bacterium]